MGANKRLNWLSAAFSGMGLDGGMNLSAELSGMGLERLKNKDLLTYFLGHD